ncbi:MAG: folylpolyglutamate synthase/dihydrofolate synthase family protein [Treponemataceae bacterium]|nr:MAG: folylpolyglutamate synthase/dihydrofolate synthase family protein [Treponemataceae bacterium]GMO52929.1 MAG: folylpolyglutamate synthase/dihydrofolate synthase family protein [Treponemataceae bacterium]
MRILDELESFLSSFLNFERLPQKNMFWLDTMEFLCGRFSNPQNASPSLHVAGSKGKGTVSAMIQGILAEAGFRCGLYTSPHVVDFSERINLGNDLFAEAEYADAFDELKNGLSGISQESFPGNRPVTWFELVTLYAFLIFRRAKCDWAVYETGLGGRLDATNVLKPKASAITLIEREHVEYLGSTLSAIAAEKAGIIKENTPVIVMKQSPEAFVTLETAAKQKNARFIYVPDCCETSAEDGDSPDTNGERVKISSPLFSRAIEATLSMRGAFQAQNAAAAAVTCKTLFPLLNETVIERGLARAVLPARFEVITRPAPFPHIPALVIDGAHTEQSIMYTVETFKRLIKASRTDSRFNAALIFACAGDKEVEKIAPLFRGFAYISLTIPGGIKRSFPERLKNAFTAAKLPFKFDDDYRAVIHEALKKADAGGISTLVTGSFYLASEVKKILQEDPATTA